MNTVITSLYIPHIFSNYTINDVTRVFRDQQIGDVKTIDFVSKMSNDGKTYNAAYVHFEKWYDTISARNLHSRVLDNKTEARIMYEEPWYWIVLENKARKHIPGERKQCIIIDDADATSHQINMYPVKKDSYNKAATALLKTHVNLDKKLSASEENQEENDWFDLIVEEQAIQMDEEEDKYLVKVDSRYLQSIEEENATYRILCQQYFAEYCKAMELYKTEAIKSQTLAEAIIMIKKMN